MIAIELPSRILPPTNSLPPRRCPCPAGRNGDGRALAEFGVIGGLRAVVDSRPVDKAAPGLKLNCGSAAGRWALLGDSTVGDTGGLF